ncbi:MAG: hypothetical protein Q9M26_02040 [Mariprofundales bacterium]|nr:hypothetical protein [Mariprofundales bacterium]
MANHVHIIIAPSDEDGLRCTFADWRWSSVGSHLSGQDSKLVKVSPVLDRYGDFAGFLAQENISSAAFKRLRQSETTGRPFGSKIWIDQLSVLTGRELKTRKRSQKISLRAIMIH